MAHVSIEAYNPIIVDLWGKEYETVDATRAMEQRAFHLEREVEKYLSSGPGSELAKQIEDEPDKADELLDGWTVGVVELLAKLIDLKLKPVEGSTKASTHIRAKWKAKKLTIQQLQRFIASVGAEEGKANRPFSGIGPS